MFHKQKQYIKRQLSYLLSMLYRMLLLTSFLHYFSKSFWNKINLYEIYMLLLRLIYQLSIYKALSKSILISKSLQPFLTTYSRSAIIENFKQTMTNKQVSLILIISVLIILASTKDTSPAGTLKLDSPLEVTLTASSPKTFNITIPQGITSTDSLFIHAAPIIADPFQVPYLTITGQSNFQQHCFNADAQFAGICRISSSDLAEQKSLTLTLRCLTKCDLEVEAYLAGVMKLQLGSSIDLTAHDNEGLSQLIHVEVPQEDYTLAVMAVILNPQQSIYEGQEGVDLFINFGNDVSDPNEQNFQIKASSLNGGGKGTFLYRDKVKSGFIKALVKIKKGVSVRFSVSPLRGKQFQINLGQSYYDYALRQQEKLYTLYLGDSLQNDFTLELVFDVYSGRPQFQLSFNQTFTSLIDFPQTSSANSILISPDIRKRFNFTDTLFIKVVTQQTAEYYFYTQLVREDVTYLQPYLTYFDEVDNDKVQNYILFERYKYKKDSTKQVRNFSFKVDIASGSGSFHFKRCPSLQYKPQQNPNFGDCLLYKATDLKTDAFYNEQIQNKNIQSGTMMTIYMVYDVTKCTPTKQAEEYIHVLCAFQIMSLGESTEPFSFSLLPQRKYLANYLREGKLIKQYIPRDNYAYFALSLPDIDKVQEVNIFMTSLSGDAAILVSTTDKLPTFASQAIKQSGAKCNIVLKKEQIEKEIYISVYAYQFTQINLGVVVHRKSDPGSIHDIPLQQGNLQTYVLNQTQTSAQFIISIKQQKQVSLLINQISGHVKLSVIDQENKAVTCTNTFQERVTCKFAPNNYKDYTVKVQKENDTPQAKFSITYKTQRQECFTSSLNHPLYVTLAGKSTSCFNFNINRQIDLELAFSFTHLQIMDKQITTSVYLNQQPQSTVNSSHYSLTVSNLVQKCSIGTIIDSLPKTCKVSVNFENKVQKDNFFNFIVEEQDADIALFDGVNEKVKGVNAESGQGKRFYYRITSDHFIQIFFSTQSLKSHYFLASKFVSNDDFLLRNKPGKDIYLPYVSQRQRADPKIQQRNNYYTALLGKTGLQTISIGQSAIQQYCPSLDCYLVISVYREQYMNSIEVDEDFYELEVTQEETVITLGETKMGTVDKGDIYTYIVNPEDAIVQFKLLQTESRRKTCLNAEAALANGTIIKRNQLALNMQISKSDKIQRIFVRGTEDGCIFEISYLSNDIPYRVVRLSQPYQLDLKANQVARFIYYHQNPRTFKIANQVSAGSAISYILPIKSQMFNLGSLTKINFKNYPIVSTYDGEYTMAQNDPNFCSKCYYYILLTTQTRYVGQVVFLRLYDPIPLTTNHVFKEHLVPLTTLGVQNYIYYALASFNLTINMLSGKIEVFMIDPEGKVVIDQQISEKKVYQLKAIDYQEKDKVQFYSQRAKYKIRVGVIDQAQFYVEVNRLFATQRLFEGYPSKILLKADEAQTVQFINSQDLNKPLNLMINIDEKNQDQALLTFSLRGERNNGEAIQSDKLLKEITKSDNTYILNLLNFEGRYFIVVLSNTKVNSTFILIRTALTHISPKQNYLFNTNGVYQVYSNYKKIMFQVFNCQGEVTLIGSKDERDMQQKFEGQSPITLKRPNYGGHYVFATGMTFASYYIRIKSKQYGQPLEYLVNYYYYEDVNPYEVVDVANYDITVQYEREGLKLKVTPPAIIDYNQNSSYEVQISIVEVTYSAYVSSSIKDLKRYSRCLIQGNVAEKTKQTQPSIILQGSLLAGLNAKNVTLYATVQASIKISIKHSDQIVVDNSPSTLTLLYNTVQFAPGNITITTIVQQTYAYWFTDSLSLFVGWMILPFILAAASLYYLLKYCLQRLMMRQTNMVQQVEIVPSNQTIPTQQKIAAPSDNTPQPDTGTQMIKEHI